MRAANGVLLFLLLLLLIFFLILFFILLFLLVAAPTLLHLPALQTCIADGARSFGTVTRLPPGRANAGRAGTGYRRIQA